MGVAFAVTAGAVVAVSARDARTALVGLAVALSAAPFLADPMPPLPTLAARVVGAALAAYLVRAAVSPAGSDSEARGLDSIHTGSRAGWPTESLLAVAAWIVGLSVSTHLEGLNPVGAGVSPSDALGALNAASLATGAGLAAIVIAMVPALGAGHGFRTAVGLLVLIQGVVLFRTGVAGAPGDLEQLAGLALLVVAAIAGSVLIVLEGHATDPRRESLGSAGISDPVEPT